jgi:hypothetical protein
VADRNSKSIRCVVRRRRLLQSEQQFDHLLHLPLVRTPVSDDGALHFGRRVLEHFAPRLDRGQNRNAACVAQLERASRIGRVKHVLDHNQLRPAFSQPR